ncbi:hypothetical protein ACFPH6_05020 [Streptomyces xiangluensis]|uniref:Substrate-binding protein n=1 Tax=Streptomyces xiangluensis TaxID=2665720 RepID=A0ABV8YJ78_9ACTN
MADHNARKDARFRLALTSYDDRGDAGRAKHVARRLTDDPAVCAVVGPATVAAARFTVDLYGKAPMPVLLVSVDYEALGQPRP